MTRTFDIDLPTEPSRVRNVRLATEVLDGVTLARLSAGLTVTAQGLLGKPIVNLDGTFVFLTEDGRDPVTVNIDTGWLPFDPQVVPVPPLPPLPQPEDRLLRIELVPQRAYPFPQGVSGVRGRLIQQRLPLPSPPPQPMPVSNAPIWLQWIDDSAPGTTWADAPLRGQTDVNGNFVAILRFTPAQVPRLDAAGQLRIRVRATDAGVTLNSVELQIPDGRVTDVPTDFAWNEFQP
jgi:hypothetical protein